MGTFHFRAHSRDRNADKPSQRGHKQAFLYRRLNRSFILSLLPPPKRRLNRCPNRRDAGQDRECRADLAPRDRSESPSGRCAYDWKD